MITTLTCGEAAALLDSPPDHCISCHDDWEDYGYDMLWLDIENHQEAHVCCAIRAAFHKQHTTVKELA